MRLNGVDDRLERHQYPTTSEELIAAHGNATVELADGSERLGDVLERFGDQTFDNADDVFTTLRARRLPPRSRSAVLLGPRPDDRRRRRAVTGFVLSGRRKRSSVFKGFASGATRPSEPSAPVTRRFRR